MEYPKQEKGEANLNKKNRLRYTNLILGVLCMAVGRTISFTLPSVRLIFAQLILSEQNEHINAALSGNFFCRSRSWSMKNWMNDILGAFTSSACSINFTRHVWRTLAAHAHIATITDTHTHAHTLQHAPTKLAYDFGHVRRTFSANIVQLCDVWTSCICDNRNCKCHDRECGRVCVCVCGFREPLHMLADYWQMQYKQTQTIRDLSNGRKRFSCAHRHRVEPFCRRKIAAIDIRTALGFSFAFNPPAK